MKGARIVSFDAILKYGKFPLAQALSDVLEICRNELLCEVEMEFAADMSPDGRLILKLLQVRPVNLLENESDINYDELSKTLDVKYVESNKALGNGFMHGIRHIVYISPDKFDSARTREMASEIAEINNLFKDKDGGYILIGPGRWGSSDPNLGIPVKWSDISEARMIVEYSIPGFQVEPSQGTHFFQNITSLGVGYLSVDSAINDGRIDFNALGSLVCIESRAFVSLLESPQELTACIDRDSNRAVVGVKTSEV